MAVKTAFYASTVTCWEKHFDWPHCCFPNFSRNLSGKLFRLLTRFVSAALTKMEQITLKWLFQEKIFFEGAAYTHVSLLRLSKNFSVFSKEPWQGCQNGYHVSKRSFWEKKSIILKKSIFSILDSDLQWDKLLTSSQKIQQLKTLHSTYRQNFFGEA